MTERQRLLGQYVAQLFTDGVIQGRMGFSEAWDGATRAIWDDLAYVFMTVGKEATKRYASALIDRVMGELKR